MFFPKKAKKNKFFINIITSILITAFLCQNVVFASEELDGNYLASQSRLIPFFERHGLDIGDIGKVVMSVSGLKDVIKGDSGRDIEEKIKSLNQFLSDRKIKIEGTSEYSFNSSQRKIKYALFNFEEKGVMIKSLFIDPTQNLTSSELEELGIRDEEKHHLDCPGLEGVWFVNASRKEREQKPELSVSGREDRNIRDEILSLSEGDLNDAMMDAISNSNIGEIEFIKKMSDKLVRLVSGTPYSKILWHNTPVVNFSGIKRKGINRTLDGKLFFQYFNFQDGLGHLFVLTELARATWSGENTYGNYSNGSHGAVIFPLSETNYDLDGSIKWFYLNNTDPDVDSSKFKYVDLSVNPEAINDLINEYFGRHSEVRDSDILRQAIAILYLKAIWLDRLYHFMEGVIENRDSDRLGEDVPSKGTPAMAAVKGKTAENGSTPFSAARSKYVEEQGFLLDAIINNFSSDGITADNLRDKIKEKIPPCLYAAFDAAMPEDYTDIALLLHDFIDNVFSGKIKLPLGLSRKETDEAIAMLERNFCDTEILAVYNAFYKLEDNPIYDLYKFYRILFPQIALPYSEFFARVVNGDFAFSINKYLKRGNLPPLEMEFCIAYKKAFEKVYKHELKELRVKDPNLADKIRSVQIGLRIPTIRHTAIYKAEKLIDAVASIIAELLTSWMRPVSYALQRRSASVAQHVIICVVVGVFLMPILLFIVFAAAQTAYADPGAPSWNSNDFSSMFFGENSVGPFKFGMDTSMGTTYFSGTMEHKPFAGTGEMHKIIDFTYQTNDPLRDVVPQDHGVFGGISLLEIRDDVARSLYWKSYMQERDYTLFGLYGGKLVSNDVVFGKLVFDMGEEKNPVLHLSSEKESLLAFRTGFSALYAYHLAHNIHLLQANAGIDIIRPGVSAGFQLPLGTRLYFLDFMPQFYLFFDVPLFPPELRLTTGIHAAFSIGSKNKISEKTDPYEEVSNISKAGLVSLPILIRTLSGFYGGFEAGIWNSPDEYPVSGDWFPFGEAVAGYYGERFGLQAGMKVDELGRQLVQPYFKTWLGADWLRLETQVSYGSPTIEGNREASYQVGVLLTFFPTTEENDSLLQAYPFSDRPLLPPGWNAFAYEQGYIHKPVLPVIEREAEPLQLTMKQKYSDDSEPSGFKIGGVNTQETIAKMDSLTGVSIEEIERRSRPGEYSEAGFLGQNESFKGVLMRDNEFVLSQGLTHQQLAEPLFYIMNLYNFLASKHIDIREQDKWSWNFTFTYKGHKYHVSGIITHGCQESIFNDGFCGNGDYTVTNLETRESFSFAPLVAHYIWRYGFYEGFGTEYRTHPSKIIRVFNLKGSDKVQEKPPEQPKESKVFSEEGKIKVTLPKIKSQEPKAEDISELLFVLDEINPNQINEETLIMLKDNVFPAIRIILEQNKDPEIILLAVRCYWVIVKITGIEISADDVNKNIALLCDAIEKLNEDLMLYVDPFTVLMMDIPEKEISRITYSTKKRLVLAVTNKFKQIQNQFYIEACAIFLRHLASFKDREILELLKEHSLSAVKDIIKTSHDVRKIIAAFSIEEVFAEKMGFEIPSEDKEALFNALYKILITKELTKTQEGIDTLSEAIDALAGFIKKYPYAIDYSVTKEMLFDFAGLLVSLLPDTNYTTIGFTDAGEPLSLKVFRILIKISEPASIKLSLYELVSNYLVIIQMGEDLTEDERNAYEALRLVQKILEVGSQNYLGQFDLFEDEFLPDGLKDILAKRLKYAGQELMGDKETDPLTLTILLRAEDIVYSSISIEELKIIYSNPIFQKATEDMSLAGKYSVARAIELTLKRFGVPVNNENIERVLPYIIKARELYKEKIVLDENSKTIFVSHDNFDPSTFENMLAKIGLGEIPTTIFKGGKHKRDVLKAIRKMHVNKNGNIFIYFMVHGYTDKLWLNNRVSISYKELADVLVSFAKSRKGEDKGKTSDIVFVFDNCFAGSFGVNYYNNLLKYLREKKEHGDIIDLPQVIAATNRDVLGYGTVLIDSVSKTLAGKGEVTYGDLMGTVDQNNFEYQDTTFFLALPESMYEALRKELTPEKEPSKERPKGLSPELPVIDAIGKFREISPVLITETGELVGIIENIETGEKIDFSEINKNRFSPELKGIRKYIDQVKAFIEALPDNTQKTLLKQILALFMANHPEYIFFRNQASKGFFGMGNGNKRILIIDEEFIEYPLAFLHEIIEYVKNEVLIDLITKQLEPQTGYKWFIEHKEKYEAKELGEWWDANEAHYIIRAFTRQVFGEKDEELTRMIKLDYRPIENGLLGEGSIPIVDLLGGEDNIPKAKNDRFGIGYVETIFQLFDDLRKIDLDVKDPEILVIGGSIEEIRFLFKRYPEATLTVVNLDMGMLSEIKRFVELEKKYQNQIKLYHADASHLNCFADMSFDLIFARGVDMTAFDDTEVGMKTLKGIGKEIERLTKPGGIVFWPTRSRDTYSEWESPKVFIASDGFKSISVGSLDSPFLRKQKGFSAQYRIHHISLLNEGSFNPSDAEVLRGHKFKPIATEQLEPLVYEELETQKLFFAYPKRRRESGLIQESIFDNAKKAGIDNLVETRAIGEQGEDSTIYLTRVAQTYTDSELEQSHTQAEDLLLTMIYFCIHDPKITDNNNLECRSIGGKLHYLVFDYDSGLMPFGINALIPEMYRNIIADQFKKVELDRQYIEKRISELNITRLQKALLTIEIEAILHLMKIGPDQLLFSVEEQGKENNYEHLAKDIGSTFTLFDSLLNKSFKENRKYKIRYDLDRLSGSQVKIIEQYLEAVKTKLADPKNIEIQPFRSSKRDYLMRVECYTEHGKLLGEGQIDIGESEKLDDCSLRMIGMLNIVFSAANVGNQYNLDDPLIRFIKEQYKLITGVDPVGDFDIRNIILPKPEKLDLNEADRLNRLAAQVLISA